jgi:hypothetical protein
MSILIWNRMGREKLRSGGGAPSTLRRVPRRLLRSLAGLLVLLAVLVPAACGGDDAEDVQALLDKAFEQDIKSADLNVDARLQLEGTGSLDRPLRIQATGPFRSNEGKLPSVDLELRLGSDGGGQTVQTGFLSTGDRAFVKFQDVYYEQPPEQVRQANESIRRNQGDRSSLRSLGLNPRSWLKEADERGEEKVAGTDTTHVSGSLDVRAFLRDLNDFVKRSGGAIGGATGQNVPAPLSEEDIEKTADVVRSNSFDVYVGKDDDTIRRVSGRLDFTVPEEDRGSLGDVEGGSFDISVEFADVNGDQEIEAPANARPLSELTRSLGTGALGGTVPQQQPPSGNGAQPPPVSGTPDADAFREYGECLEQAPPGDADALQRCNEMLQP